MQGLKAQAGTLWNRPWDKASERRGSILGLADCHTRAHLYHAINEGIGFGLYDGLVSIQKKTKIKVEYLSVAGGGAQSDEICQITANLMGLPVRKVQTYEMSSLGTAITAFVGIGIYKTFSKRRRKNDKGLQGI